MEDKIRISYPDSEKVYLNGHLYPDIRVAMRKINLTPTVTIENGEKVMRENAPVYVYDTSGPYSDPSIEIDLKQGLPRLREEWILKRGDVEQLSSLTSEYGKARLADKNLDHQRRKTRKERREMAERDGAQGLSTIT